jgi:thioredoxin-dependent peroxiredoxin
MKLPVTLILALMLALTVAAKADPLKVGDKAPAVSGPTDTGAQLNLADVYKKQTYTLVYFYPKAGTSGCTKQGCSLRDDYAALTARGVAVIGVSADNVADQAKFKEAQHFQFTLIADTDKAVINAFGVPTYPGVGYAHRQAYLIKDGTIVWADYKAATDKQAQDVEKVLDGMKG